MILWRGGSLLITVPWSAVPCWPGCSIGKSTFPPSFAPCSWLCTLVGAAGSSLTALLWHPLAARSDDLALALRIEEQYPVLNDALASTVQFLQQPSDSRTGSPVLRREAVVRAMRLAQGCNFNQVVNARGLRLASFVARFV